MVVKAQVNFHLLKKQIPDFIYSFYWDFNKKLHFWGYLLPLLEHQFFPKTKTLSQSKHNMGPEHCQVSRKNKVHIPGSFGHKYECKAERTD